jgi:GNAT superfamily N-acetyltransferase
MTIEFGTLKDAIGGMTILARTGSEIIGSLQLTAPRALQDNARLVLMIQVEEAHRRKGIATALWKFAKDNGFNPIHELEQTQEGKAWAQVVGN